MTSRSTGRSRLRRLTTPAAAAGIAVASAILATGGSVASPGGSATPGGPATAGPTTAAPTAATHSPSTGIRAGAGQSHRAGHVTGDAWVSFSIDPGNPLRRFIFSAHGNPYKVVDGRFVMGDASGTVRFNHRGPDPDGVVRDHWGKVDVDYLMTTGPVAVVSGTSTGGHGWPAGTRMSFSVYDDPRGDRYDRVGFSWGVVDGRCHRMGMAPAPFTTYASGKGYTVRAAALPAIAADVLPPVDPPACTDG